MVRLFVVVIIILFFFIVYNIIKSLFRENQKLRSGQAGSRTRTKKYNDIEEADYKEIESKNKKNEKDGQE
jgi:flagellar biosynthesis/type III secretory pathway M-ring protein FliF/YscJ